MTAVSIDGAARLTRKLLTIEPGLGADMVANADRSFESVAALEAAPKPALAAGRTLIASVMAFHAGADEGGGQFRWQANSNQAAVPGMIVNPTGNAGSGRWVRIWEGNVFPEWTGADGGADDTAAVQAAISLANVNGTMVELTAGRTYSVGKLHYGRVAIFCSGLATLKALPGAVAEGEALILSADINLRGVFLDGDENLDRLAEATGKISWADGGGANVVGTANAFGRIIHLKPTCTSANIKRNQFSAVTGVEDGNAGNTPGAETAIYIENKNFSISQNSFSEIGGYEDGDCIRVQLPASADLIWEGVESGHISQNVFAIKKRAVKLQASYVVVSANRITSAATDETDCPYAGIETFGTSNKILGNKIELSRAVSGILDQGGVGTVIGGRNEVSVSGATVYLTARGSATSAIRLNNSTAAVVSENLVLAGGAVGVTLQSAVDCTIERHTERWANGTGNYINVEISGGSGNKVRASTLSGKSAGVRSVYAVQINNATGCEIASNNFDNCSSAGIRYNGAVSSCLNEKNRFGASVPNRVNFTGVTAANAVALVNRDSRVNQAVSATTINAGASYTVDVPYLNAYLGKPLYAVPLTDLEAGLTFSVAGSGTGTARLTISNVTAGNINMAARTWALGDIN